MQLTGKEILSRCIVYNTCPEAIQQQGVDVRLDKVFIVNPNDSERAMVPVRGKTILPDYFELQPMEAEDGNMYYKLAPGYYEVELMEGVKVPNNISLHFKTRSSLVRCGAIVHSGQFDAGFETPKAGCFLHVIKPIWIGKGARIAQAICFESSEVINVYDGQWQNDRQREGKAVAHIY